MICISLCVATIGTRGPLAETNDPLSQRARASQSDQAVGSLQLDLSCVLPTEIQPAFLLNSKASSETQIFHYSGTIGNQRIVMMLRQFRRQLSGFYFYERFRAPIQLRGQVQNGTISVTEFGESRDPGRITGTFETSGDPTSRSLTGTWLSPHKERRLPFTLSKTEPPPDGGDILLSWDRFSLTGSYEAWARNVDYSPVTNELIYLEEPNVLSVLDLSTMKSRKLYQFEFPLKEVPSRVGAMVVGKSTIGHVVVSHSGEKVAFSAGTGYPVLSDIYVMGIREARPLKLTDSLGDFMNGQTLFYPYDHPKFSPDDNTVLLERFGGNDRNQSSANVYVVEALGGTVRALGEGYSERAYWSADGSRVCTYSDSRTARKIVYEVPSGRASVGGTGSYDRDEPCRIIADAASAQTCETPPNNLDFESERLYQGIASRPVQRWVTPDIAINTYELSSPPGYRIQIVRTLN